MKTYNNIIATVDTPPVMKYIRIPKHGITGWRLNPDDNWRKLEFALVGSEEGFDYERDVIELYSDKEVRFFKQANRYLFKEGMLSEYKGEPKPLDTTNMLTDEEVHEIALLRNVSQLKSRLEGLTSKVSMQRIYEIAQEVGRPAKTLEVIKARLDILQA